MVFTTVFTMGAAYAFLRGDIHIHGTASVNFFVSFGVESAQIIDYGVHVSAMSMDWGGFGGHGGFGGNASFGGFGGFGGFTVPESPLRRHGRGDRHGWDSYHGWDSFHGWGHIWEEPAITIRGANAEQRFDFEQHGYVIVQYRLRNTGTLPVELHSVGFGNPVQSHYGLSIVRHSMSTCRWSLMPGFHVMHTGFGLELGGHYLPVNGYKDIFVKVSYEFDYEMFWHILWHNPMQLLAMSAPPDLMQLDFHQWDMQIIYSMARR